MKFFAKGADLAQRRSCAEAYIHFFILFGHKREKFLYIKCIEQLNFVFQRNGANIVFLFDSAYYLAVNKRFLQHFHSLKQCCD